MSRHVSSRLDFGVSTWGGHAKLGHLPNEGEYGYGISKWSVNACAHRLVTIISLHAMA